MQTKEEILDEIKKIEQVLKSREEDHVTTYNNKEFNYKDVVDEINRIKLNMKIKDLPQIRKLLIEIASWARSKVRLSKNLYSTDEAPLTAYCYVCGYHMVHQLIYCENTSCWVYKLKPILLALSPLTEEELRMGQAKEPGLTKDDNKDK